MLTPADHTALAVAKRGLRAAGHDSVRGRPTVVGSWRGSGAVTSRLCGSLSVRFSPGAIAAKVGVRSLANRVGTFSATRGGHLSRRGADLDAVYRHGVRQRSGSRHVRSRRTASAGAAELGLEAKPPRHRGEQSLRETRSGRSVDGMDERMLMPIVVGHDAPTNGRTPGPVVLIVSFLSDEILPGIQILTESFPV